jgi:hypothetical protein
MDGYQLTDRLCVPIRLRREKVSAANKSINPTLIALRFILVGDGQRSAAGRQPSVTRTPGRECQ